MRRMSGVKSVTKVRTKEVARPASFRRLLSVCTIIIVPMASTVLSPDLLRSNLFWRLCFFRSPSLPSLFHSSLPPPDFPLPLFCLGPVKCSCPKFHLTFLVACQSALSRTGSMLLNKVRKDSTQMEMRVVTEPENRLGSYKRVGG